MVLLGWAGCRSTPPASPSVAGESAGDPVAAAVGGGAGADAPQEWFWRKVKLNGRREAAYAQLAARRAADPEIRARAEQWIIDQRQLEQDLVAVRGRENLRAENSTRYSATQAAYAGVVAEGERAGPTGPVKEGAVLTSRTVISTTAPWADPGDMAPGPAGFVPATATTRAHEEWKRRDRLYARLAGKSGAAFDRAFLDVMVDEQRDAVALLEYAGQAPDAADPALREFARKYLPKLREHLDQAQQLQRASG